MAKSICAILFISTLIFLISPLSFAVRPPPIKTPITTPSLNVERLIRSLNLIPGEAHFDSRRKDSWDNPEKRIVEKSFVFPGLDASNGTSVGDLGHHAGYYRLNHTHDSRLFYFFFESRNNKKDDPVVIWMTGGPGCSSELALFYENGPFQVANNLSLIWNDFGWDQASNIIFVDQPVGTGFSYTSDERDIRHTENGVSNDLFDFLQAFFSEHSEYQKNDFYITGESYAGHYVPALASRVHQGNVAKEGIHINMKGFAIGNGLTDPAIQYAAYADFGLENGLINQSGHDIMNEMAPTCEAAVQKCGTSGTNSCAYALIICQELFSYIDSAKGNINYYDIRKPCIGNLCYDFSNVEKFLNQKSIKDALGVGDIEFVSCSKIVYEAMVMDWMRNSEVGIPALLEHGIKVLIYAGEYDLICNWLGNWRWVHAMEWSGRKNFVSSPELPFKVDGAEVGILKTHGPLSFLKVHNAGHMVPMDQPKAALEMLRRWTQGKLHDPSSVVA